MGGAARAKSAEAFVDAFGDLDMGGIGVAPRSQWVVEGNELVMNDMEELVVRTTFRKLGGPVTRAFDTPLGIDADPLDGSFMDQRQEILDEWVHSLADLFDIPVAEARARAETLLAGVG